MNTSRVQEPLQYLGEQMTDVGQTFFDIGSIGSAGVGEMRSHCCRRSARRNPCRSDARQAHHRGFRVGHRCCLEPAEHASTAAPPERDGEMSRPHTAQVRFAFVQKIREYRQFQVVRRAV